MSGPAPQYCGRLGTAGSGDVEYLAEGNSDAGHEVGAEPGEGPLDEAAVVDGPKLVDEQV
jgi:hypothetical protein